MRSPCPLLLRYRDHIKEMPLLGARRLPPLPLSTLEVGVAVELVAKPPRMGWLKCGGPQAEGSVQLGNKLLHPLAGAHGELRWRAGVFCAGLRQPPNRESS